MVTDVQARAIAVEVTDEVLRIELADGRTVTVPLTWFPRLLRGTVLQRANFRLLGLGEGIHWPELDEDLSVAGILRTR